jgi:aminoglycoside phosphotransferase (APT) family kinase protein
MGLMANLMPAAEIDVTADLVRALLAKQHPDLADLPVEFMANGWDNALFRVGPRLVARLPRRAQAAPIIVNEQRWLPALAARLPLAVPYPERTGVPALGYPWSWSLVPYLPGVPAADVPSLDPAAAATAVGGFLRALHRPAPADAPENPWRGVWVGEREESFMTNLRTVGDKVDEAAALRVWSAAVAAPRRPGPPTWVHGDLHPANILVHEGRVSGVIDFGDITSGDPACDLAVAWMLLPLSGHEPFWDAYGRGDDPALRARARGWALRLGLVFSAFSADNPRMLAIGERALSRVLEPCP